LEQMQLQTKALNIFNSHHTAQKTRNSQIKEEQHQAALWHSYQKLSAAPMLPLVNRPAATAEFPLHLLPAEIAEDVCAISNVTGWGHFPSLVAMLGEVSISFWGRYVAVPYEGYVEPVVIDLIVAARSGDKKTPLVEALIAPMQAFSDELRETYEMVNVEVKEIIEFMPGAIKKKTRKKIQQIVEEYDGDFDGMFRESQKIIGSSVADRKRLDKMRVYPSKILIDNITPKKLIKVLKENGGVANVFGAEMGFLKEFVKENGLGVNIVLKGNSMEKLDYDTCNGEAEVYKTATNIISIVQPETAEETIYKRHREDNDIGIAPRFDIYFAEKPSVTREFNENALQRYYGKISGNLRRNYTQEQPRPLYRISLSPEAKRVFINFMNEVNGWIDQDMYKHMVSYISKIAGRSLRWAALLHGYIHEHPESFPISLETMQVAIAIVRHLIPHADYAFRSDGLKAYPLAQRIMAWLRLWEQPYFSLRELQRGLGGNILKGTIEPALRLLERHNIVRLHQAPQGGLHCLIHPRARCL